MTFSHLHRPDHVLPRLAGRQWEARLRPADLQPRLAGRQREEEHGGGGADCGRGGGGGVASPGLGHGARLPLPAGAGEELTVHICASRYTRSEQGLLSLRRPTRPAGGWPR